MNHDSTTVSEAMRAVPPRFRDQFPTGSWFDGLPAELLRRLTAYGRTFCFDPGETLVEEGVPDEWLHVIIAGRVDLECGDPVSGRPIKILKLGPGSITGERGILDTDPPAATARAVTEVTTYRLNHTALALMVLSVREAVVPFERALQRTIDEVELRRQFFVDPETRERAEELFRASRPSQRAANGVART